MATVAAESWDNSGHRDMVQRLIANGAVLAFAALGLRVPAPLVAAGQQQPGFRAGVDLISVDVQVVGSNGQPLLGLGPSSFEVTIDGKARRVVSADLMQYATAGGDTSIRPQMLAANRWPADGQPGRTFMMVVDVSSFTAGEMVGVLQAAWAFVDRLPASDLVGVFSLPHGALLGPTADRPAVRRALTTMAGQRGLRSAQFNLTAAEIIDITAADGLMNPLPGRGTAPIQVDPNDALRQVQMRECRSTADVGCTQGILAEAASMSRQFQEQAEESVAGLEALLRLLQEYPTRQTVVLLSAGMPVSDRQGSWFRDGGPARNLGRGAALADATIYALHIERQASSAGYSAETRTARRDFARERDLEQQLLSELAVSSGGALFSAPTGSPAVALERLLVETSSVYLLGIAPDKLDLDGRAHELRVKVSTRGATVRSRRFVALRRSG